MRRGNSTIAYCYDAWGNCTVVTNTDSIATMNPFRYRGYYLDVETNLYYLQNRYYDSYVGRFINADGLINGNRDMVGFNMFAYCSNNPVMFTDPMGEGLWQDICDWCTNVRNWLDTYALNRDGTYSLHDSDRFEDKNPYHDQLLAFTFSSPEFDLLEGSIGLGSIEVDAITVGWEWEHFDISLLDFGHAEVSAEIKDGGVSLGAMASAWSPSTSFSFWGITIEIGAEIGAIGVGFSGSTNGFSIKGASAVGFNLGISWD